VSPYIPPEHDHVAYSALEYQIPNPDKSFLKKPPKVLVRRARLISFGFGAAELRFCSEARDQRSMVENEGIAHRPLVNQSLERISAGVQRFKVGIVPNTPPKGLDER